MLYAIAALPLAVLSANTVEVTTSDVRHGAAFDNLKASWGKALSIGDFKTNLRCNYDYNDNRDFLKEVNFQGDLLGDGADVQVSYDVNHNFKSANTDVTLGVKHAQGKLSVDYSTDANVKEVTLERSLDVADYSVDLKPSWLVQAKTARVKMMSALGGGRASLQADYNTGGGSVDAVEVGYSHNMEDGKDVSAIFSPNSKNLEVEYVDSKFENGATWTATANVALDSGKDILDAAKVTLKRAWSW